MSEVKELAAMFPHIDRPVLAQVLQLHQNDVEESIEYLLNHPSNMSILANLGLNDDTGFENEAIPPHRKEEKFVEISPVPLLATALRGAINDATFSDVILVTSDHKEVHGHQFILAARSEYLQVLLSSIPFEQGKKKRLELEMKENTLLKVVKYLYTDETKLAEEELHAVYLEAQLLGLNRLRQICEQADEAFCEPSTFNTDFLKAFKALNFKHFDALENQKQNRNFKDQGEQENAEFPYLETSEDKTKIGTLKEDFNSDITLIINDKPIHCHKIILVSSCEYFKAMFMGFMKEKELNEIKLEDCPDFNSFLIMLECIYMNGRLRENQVTPANALGVFLAANQFMVPSLQKYCEKIIKENIDTETVCELLDITDSLSESMKFICLQYIFSHYNEVINSPEYQKLSETLKMEIQQRFELESQNSLISFFRAVAHQDVDDVKLAIKTEILTFLEDQFDIGDIETEFEDVTATPIGEVTYTVDDMVMRQPDDETIVDPDDVVVNFTSTKLEIEIKKWTAHVVSMNWAYRQLAFPNLSDEGQASAKILGGEMKLVFDVVPPIMGVPGIKIFSLDIKVKGIEIYIKEAKAAWLYNILMKLFSTKIKNTMETALNVMLLNSVEDLVQNINNRGLQMVADADV